jgi:hypothetical protein
VTQQSEGLKATTYIDFDLHPKESLNYERDVLSVDDSLLPLPCLFICQVKGGFELAVTSNQSKGMRRTFELTFGPTMTGAKQVTEAG